MPRGVYKRAKVKASKRAPKLPPEFDEVAIRPKRVYKMQDAPEALYKARCDGLEKELAASKAECRRLEQLVILMAEKLL